MSAFVSFRKRYDRAEQEFVEAKIDLHHKSETKESLTEHLYTIIHQNEIRKAKKLTELMEKLQLESGEEASPVRVDLSGLPSMALLNAIHTLEQTSPTSPPANCNAQGPISTSDESEVVCHGEDSETKLTAQGGKKKDDSDTNSIRPDVKTSVGPLGRADSLNRTVSVENGNKVIGKEVYKSDSPNLDINLPNVANVTAKVDIKDQNENLDSQLQTS